MIWSGAKHRPQDYKSCGTELACGIALIAMKFEMSMTFQSQPVRLAAGRKMIPLYCKCSGAESVNTVRWLDHKVHY